MNFMTRRFLFVLLVVLSSSQVQGCMFNGGYYSNNDTIQGVCAEVICIEGKWDASSNKISECCDKCCARDDPHINTTDGCTYDNHDKCEFSMVQTGFSLNPKLAVFNKFIDCPGGAFPGRTCVGPVTFKPDCNTAVKMDLRNADWTNLYVDLDGSLRHIDTHPMEIKKGLLIWQTSENCIRAMDDKGILVEYCITRQKKDNANNVILQLHSLCIYQPPCFKNYSVVGLCGHYDGSIIGEFVHRNGSTEECGTGKNRNRNFSPTWETTKGNCTVPASRSDEEAENDCPLKEVSDRCTAALKDLLMDDTQRQDEIEFCITDVCAMKRSRSSESDIETHLRNTRDAVQKIIRYKPLRGHQTNRENCSDFPPTCLDAVDHCGV